MRTREKGKFGSIAIATVLAVTAWYLWMDRPLWHWVESWFVSDGSRAPGALVDDAPVPPSGAVQISLLAAIFFASGFVCAWMLRARPWLSSAGIACLGITWGVALMIFSILVLQPRGPWEAPPRAIVVGWLILCVLATAVSTLGAFLRRLGRGPAIVR